ncbi:methylated-DNA--[protein]-cysteine S-methyltransferase [Paenibacillus polymyxa]|uniref:methylated-DNA--[protein]-cysteine S-methyltransferase n=1 Tax=Paenibacillus TaxID=44249 RepID=UPI000F4E0C6D|nr:MULTISPECIES: methylated-DNA--[protein]-cysteine S-methyltransferase [Paenibacillus]KAF6655860.1 methylated-DNA--[protein]-cysteine S-methyltransferase [Paenibacillus sp. EKM301P]RPE00716.1 methylated-DNA--[protein]-cysteine S-methyltransferase [Paenibacillus polymyxa]UBS86464.1 methylated-DNA--[protein]-cysteine S-methyltransferase [Paenibacillus polymyxa]WHX34994.1 methylated-DNA--[protein]-cysteine S-methyltransferase [Paenibacillus polymyxa]
MVYQMNKTIYWSLLVHEDWNLYIAATSEGLCYVGSLNQPVEELLTWAGSRFPGSPLVEEVTILQPYAKELIEYLQGERTRFTFPFDFQGTAFQMAVWNALCNIPYGETQSYSDIANAIQKPNSVRAVGTAIGANPILVTIPCHRVIGKNGALTGYRGGLDMKVKLLQLEKNCTHKPI